MLVCFSAISIYVTTSKGEIEDSENVLPVMWAHNEFIERYQND
jgi:hypothetical protein